MFCSCCGMTLHSDDKVCGNCGKPVGAAKFSDDSHTSNQDIIPAQEAVNGEGRYVRLAYDNNADNFEEFESSGTTYRPVFTEEPEEVEEEKPFIDFDDIGDNVDAYAANLNLADLNLDEYSTTEVEYEEQHTEFSEGFKEYMIQFGQLDVDEEPAEPAKKEETEDAPVFRHGKHAAKEPKEETETVKPEYQPLEDAEPDEERVYSSADSNDEFIDDYESEAKKGAGNRIVKIALAVVAVVAIFVCGILFVPKLINAFTSKASAPIEGVTLDLYNSTIAKLENNASEKYREDAYTIFKNGSYQALTAKLASDAKEITNATVESPLINDELFVKAASALQDDIANAISFDAVEIASTGSVSSEESKARWETVEGSIASFKAINSASGLNQVIAGERIIYVEATPTPAPQASAAPEYPTLSKGDDNEDVKKMQERLIELGYLKDGADGKFGKNTVTAIKKFQEAVGIEVTGIADSQTQALLYANVPEEEPVEEAPVEEIPAEEEAPSIEPEEVEDTTVAL